METEYIALYAGDSLYEGTVCGPSTIRRCNAMIAYVLKNPTKKFFVFLGAGKRPDKLSYPPLKTIMASYIQTCVRLHQITNLEIVLTEKDAWRTWYETRSILETLDEYDPDQITVITSWYHMFRVRKIWKLLAPHQQVQKVFVWYVPTLFSLLWEIGGWTKIRTDYRMYRNPS